MAVENAVFHAKFQGIVNLLPQIPLLAAGDGELLVDNQTGYALTIVVSDKMRFRLVQFEPHLTQHSFHLLVDAIERTVCRKGHVIAIAGICDLALTAPTTDVIIKAIHNDIG